MAARVLQKQNSKTEFSIYVLEKFDRKIRATDVQKQQTGNNYKGNKLALVHKIFSNDTKQQDFFLFMPFVI